MQPSDSSTRAYIAKPRARAFPLPIHYIFSVGERTELSGVAPLFPSLSTLPSRPEYSALAQRKHRECVFQFGPVPVGRCALTRPLFLRLSSKNSIRPMFTARFLSLRLPFLFSLSVLLSSSRSWHKIIYGKEKRRNRA